MIDSFKNNYLIYNYLPSIIVSGNAHKKQSMALHVPVATNSGEIEL